MSLSDRVIVMKDGEIKQIGAPQEVYEDPASKFVAGFVGKAAFFPAELVMLKPYLGAEHSMPLEGPAGTWVCRVGKDTFEINRFAPDVQEGKPAVIMARPESLRLTGPGQGTVEGTVRMNVYLGHSIETFVETSHGEVLIQVDDPASKKIYPEGAKVSISLNPDRVRLLRED
jgi:iron(III) transport system ATP-binding protein